MSNPSTTDVLICGGGLAGLTLALQLRQRIPTCAVTVIERTCRPLPPACHKVGESTVELAGHYYGTVLGLRSYLLENQLIKNGLRFFVGDPSLPLPERTEIGPGGTPISPSYQLDRGTFEADLRARVEAAGVRLIEGAVVEDVTLDPNGHRVAVRQDSGDASEKPVRMEYTARWLVDASGRRRLIQKKLGLGRPSTVRSSSSWFRIPERIKVGDLASPENEAWHRRDTADDRWLSTVHLMGQGYWVWLIPLKTGYTSVGIVADTRHHPFDTFNTEERARAWLRKHEPLVANRIADATFDDFRVMKDYAYSSTQVFSKDRWTCVGEAGMFIDPLYSVGGDFLALSNCFTTRFIADDIAGNLDGELVNEANDYYLSLASNLEAMLRDNGRMFLHPEIIGGKLWWDFYLYWACMCRFFVCHGCEAPLETFRAFRATTEKYFRLNEQAQNLFEAWAEMLDSPTTGPAFIPLPNYPSVLSDVHADLQVQRDYPDALEHMEADFITGRDMGSEMMVRALRSVGLARAKELAERARLAESMLEVTQSRIEVDDLSGGPRRHALSRVTRDLERALGGTTREESLAELARAASLPIR